MIVTLKRYNTSDDGILIAKAWVGDDGAVTSDNATLLAEWTANGIVGRFEQGRLFPKDGAAFLMELPYMYKNIYMLAAIE